MMGYDPPRSVAQCKIERLTQRISELVAKREDAIRERGRELGFSPCSDCFDGFCTMNCSTAPIIMKVMP